MSDIDNSPKEGFPVAEEKKVEFALGKMLKFVIIDPKAFKDQEHFDKKYLSFRHFVVLNSEYKVTALCHYVPSIDDLKSRNELISPIDIDVDVILNDFKVLNNSLIYQKNISMV